MRLKKTIFGRRILPNGQIISKQTYNEYLKVRKQIYDKQRYNLRKIAQVRQESLALNRRYYEREYLGNLQQIPKINQQTTKEQIKRYIEKGKQRLNIDISSTSGQQQKILNAIYAHIEWYSKVEGTYESDVNIYYKIVALLNEVEKFDVWNKWYFYDLAPSTTEFYKMTIERAYDILYQLCEYVKKRNKPNRTIKK